MDPRDVYYSDTKARNIFGYRVEDDSMGPLFRRGDIMVVNPNLSARPGDYVVARRKGETFLRRVGVSGKQLEPVSSEHNSLPTSACLILGRVVERKRLY